MNPIRSILWEMKCYTRFLSMMVLALLSLTGFSCQSSTSSNDRDESKPQTQAQLKSPKDSQKDLRYLLFQTTVTPRGRDAYREYKKEVSKIVSEVGIQEVATNRQLGFGIIIAPFMMSEKEMPQIIDAAFRVALETDMALQIAFESHYYWFARPDLWNWFDPKKPGYDPENKKNVEWIDWKGTAVKARYLDWGTPVPLPPHMCYNSKKMLAEVRRLITQIIGPAVQSGIRRFKEAGKEHLFSGITVTSEPSLDNYSVVHKINRRLSKFIDKMGGPKVSLGYCALTNKGYSRSNPPKNLQRALAEINQDWVAYWAKQFVDAGFSPSKLFNHVAAAAGLDNSTNVMEAALVEFTRAPLWITFNAYSTPGFTTYPTGSLLDDFSEIYSQLEKKGVKRWAGVEANILGTQVGWEEYIQRHFDHGAVMVNVMDYFQTSYPGPNPSKEQGPAGSSARKAFQTFLKGQRLAGVEPTPDRPTQNSFSKKDFDPNPIQTRIQSKMKRLQEKTQSWKDQGKNPRPQVDSILWEFEKLIEQQNPVEAESKLDEALGILEEN